MRKVEDINGAFLCHVTAKAWIWCFAAALLTAFAVLMIQKKNECKQGRSFVQVSTVFVAIPQADPATQKESGKTDYKIMRVAFDSEKEDAVKARYYEVHNRNTFLTDYITLLTSQKFVKTVENAYQNAWQRKCPAFQISAKLVLTDNGRAKDISRFIQITITTNNAGETEKISSVVLEQFKMEAKNLLGFNNIEIFDPGTAIPTLSAQVVKTNIKKTIAFAVLAAVLVWGIFLIILLKRSPVLNEEDILFTLGTPALTRVLRKKKQIAAESAELCCRMLEKESPEGQILIVTASTCGDSNHQAALSMTKGFAALGHDTLLIDFVSANGSAGISDLIEGKNALNEILEKKESFSYISRGSAARITTAHLNSKIFRDLVADMHMRYQTILIAVPAIIDSPAVSLLDDVADAVVLMTRAGRTREKDLALAMTQLKNCRVKKVHTVLFY